MKNLSLYIHIPFCKAKCHYCAFTSFINKQDWIAPYIEKLLVEIEHKGITAKEFDIVTIYIGGGTPSLIDAHYIEQILNSVRTNFSISKNTEITIENNPESLTSKKLEQYIQLGINRFSVGCQSLNNKTLKTIGRVHQKKEIVQVLNLFQKFNVNNYSLDFIMGLPYQTLSTFKNELKDILSFKPPHLSFYFLSPDTKRIETFFKDCPTENEQIKIYEHLIKEMQNSGFHHYEVSNYAQPGYECRHNLRYWQQKEYLGFGVSAHSYFKGNIFYNASDLDKYIANPLSTHEKFSLDEELFILDKIMLNLRTSKGLNLHQLSSLQRKTVLQNAQPFLNTSDLQLKDECISTTEKGYLILDKIVRDLF